VWRLAVVLLGGRCIVVGQHLCMQLATTAITTQPWEVLPTASTSSTLCMCNTRLQPDCNCTSFQTASPNRAPASEEPTLATDTLGCHSRRACCNTHSLWRGSGMGTPKTRFDSVSTSRESTTQWRKYPVQRETQHSGSVRSGSPTPLPPLFETYSQDGGSRQSKL
jgi:hypothetical protein